MTIIRPHAMPRFWWLCPWAYARQLHRNCVALKALCDRQDDVIRELSKQRPRWKIERWEDGKGARYYFHDTYPPEMDREWNHLVYLGKSYLYDDESRSFAYETEEAKAIERLTKLNNL